MPSANDGRLQGKQPVARARAVEKPGVEVVSESDAIREELVTLARSRGLETRGFADLASLLKIAVSTRPSCILAELPMTDRERLEIIGALRSVTPNASIIVVAEKADIRLAVAAMKAGAFDFIERPWDPAILLGAIEEAMGMSSGVSRETPEEARRRLASLTNREREVLVRLLAGKINKTIGHELGISPRTVEVYRSRIMTKVRVSSLSDLVRVGLKADLRL